MVSIQLKTSPETSNLILESTSDLIFQWYSHPKARIGDPGAPPAQDAESAEQMAYLEKLVLEKIPRELEAGQQLVSEAQAALKAERAKAGL